MDPTIVERYYKSNESAMDDKGWFDTGDVAKIHPEGYMEIVDRSKDVIKSGGEWISSIDLENAAVGHPGIAEACVIGVLHTKWDERSFIPLSMENSNYTSFGYAWMSYGCIF